MIIPPDTNNLKALYHYKSLDQWMILKDLCYKIYIARNITLDPQDIEENLRRIDKLFRDDENYN